MLTPAERLLAAALAVVLGVGVATATAVPSAGSAGAGSPTPPVVSLPSLAPPAPPPVQPTKPSPPVVRRPVPPAPPQSGCPVPKRPARPPRPARVLPPPAVAEPDLPAPLAPRAKARSLQALRGKGIWVTNFPGAAIDVPTVVGRAKAAGLNTLWVRTGGKKGYYGDTVLPRLVPAAHAAGLRVVAWDFPYLSDPVADAARARAAFADGADAFAPDVETQAEGTYASARRVALYLSLVRAHAGRRPVAATVPRPTAKRLATFPYAAFAPYADVFVPMVYWSCQEPGQLVVQSLRELGRWLPVAPVGQGYDMSDEGGRRGLPSRAETYRFLDVAKRGNAVGASLWTYEQVGAGQWDALADYRWE